ncbi:MAG: hypothetical protein LBC08_03895 [Campylobacteraceae bacterium]|nr:hypothetical protein [Campylobacteraceae bacterium]
MKNMYDLKKYRPIHLDDLTRLGRNEDGGYVLSSRQIDKTEILLSFGINDDWSFEADFLKRKEVKLYAFDKSVSYPFHVRKTIKYFFKSVFYTLLFRFKKVKKLIKIVYITSDFKKFFKPSLNRFFIRKFLGHIDDETFISFGTIFKEMLAFTPPTHTDNIKDLSVFIKMDIEKWEYSALPDIEPFIEKINGLAVEFHELYIAQKRFEDVMELLSKYFYIVHVHANNFGELIHGSNLPEVLEITFINKALVENAVLSSRSYPIEGIDFPNNSGKEDIKLDFVS